MRLRGSLGAWPCQFPLWRRVPPVPFQTSPSRGGKESVAALGRDSAPRRGDTRGHVKEPAPILRDGPSALLRMRGMARRKAQSGSSRSFDGARGRLSARQSRRLLNIGPRFSPACRATRAGRAFSQLLAGTPSGPGESPDAARVRCQRTHPAGAAPRPAFRALRDSAPQRTRRVQCNGGAEGGDKLLISG
jgi:hypothetical protein